MSILPKWILHSLYVRVNRGRVLAALRSGPEPAWPYVEALWSRATGVCPALVGPGARRPFELEVLEELIKWGADCETVLLRNLSSRNSCVAAYCLVGLARLGSTSIRHLPGELLDREDQVVVQVGCIAHRKTFGCFARGLVDEAAKLG